MTTELPKLKQSSIMEFAECLDGKRGDLDAWLEVNNEAEVKAHIVAYAEMKVAEAMLAAGASKPTAQVVTDERDAFETSVIERMKESGFLEVQIRVECLARNGDDYQDELINFGWWSWQRAILALAAQPSSEFVSLEEARAAMATQPEQDKGREPLGYIPTNVIDQIKTWPRLITTNVPVVSYSAEGCTAIYTHPAPASPVAQQPARVPDDSALLDWLAQQVVEVRIPLRYGSQQCFIGSPDDNDGEPVPWDIRAATRTAMLSASPSTAANGGE